MASSCGLPDDWDRRPSFGSIQDLVRHGYITPAQGADLYEVRRLLAWRRRPWWDRLITRLLGGGP